MGPLIPYFEVPIIRIPLPEGMPFAEIPIHGFGLLVMLGFVLGGQIAIRRADRVGLSGESINRLIGWLVVGTFVGGHVGYGLMYEPANYLANPRLFLEFWHGLSSFGGFIVCVPLAVWFFKRNKMPLWPNLDNLAVGFSFGWFLGRMGCTVAHDHPGSPSNNPLAIYCRPIEGYTVTLPEFMTQKVTDLRWGACSKAPPELQGSEVMDWNVANRAVTELSQTVPADWTGGVVAVHDTGFYEALFSLAVFVLFLILDRKPKVPGFYPLVLGLAYAPFRFWLDTMRPIETDARYGIQLMDIPTPTGQPISLFFLTPGQWISIGLFVLCAVLLYSRMRSGDAPVWHPYGTKHEEEDEPSDDGPGAGAVDDDAAAG